MAVAIGLLDLYQSLCRHSSDAVTALAAALETTYKRSGFRLLDSDGAAPTDPLRRALEHSLEWYDVLVNNIERELDNQLETLKPTLPKLPDTISSIPTPLAESVAFSMIPSRPSPESAHVPATNKSETTPADPPSHPTPRPVSEDAPGKDPPLTPGQCSAYLQRLCPACFGGKSFGASFRVGGDFHIAIDGTFHHRHLKSGGDGVNFHDSYRFEEKEFVDGVGVRIEKERKRPPKPHEPVIPDHVVDADHDSFNAAKGDKEKTTSKRFDENGVMALVCRHDIPLFAASIDTPGEQQKYAVALLEDFFSQIPPQATVTTLYDIGCVLDRSLRMVSQSILCSVK
ncbi:hypothetical protein V5O48_019003 [Marasmius crinis-equi]|uniref:Uncharacterized protein n=1 Tax=Marasmius crinis-equi TaxID=585013 RepID=A0ABR3EJN9_9AGAR